MDTKVSYREIDIENSQNGPKTASTVFFVGEWLQYTSGLLAPLTPATPIVGLNLTPVVSTEVGFTNTALITFDGVNSTEDRFIMPVATTIAYGTLVGVFTAGEIVLDTTSGAKAVILTDNGATSMVVQIVSGTIFATDNLVGQTSGATAVVGSVTGVVATNLGVAADIFSDSTSLDATTIGTGTQFVITQIISLGQVEVAAVLLLL